MDRMTISSPPHIGIIMDGNGRWAKMRGLPKRKGHERGVTALRELIRSTQDVDLQYLTLYGFSSENWNRPKGEVQDLLGLLRLYINQDLEELAQNGVKIKVIGARHNLSSDLVRLIEKAERRTVGNRRVTLVIAFNYGGRNEIADAAQMAARRVQAGEISPAEITPDLLERHLYTHGIPDPDLIIRTSGEKRLSNFLTWQSAYSELVFTDVLWPDFGRQHLLEAIAEYYRRDRRYGGRPDEQANSDCANKYAELGKAG